MSDTPRRGRPRPVPGPPSPRRDLLRPTVIAGPLIDGEARERLGMSGDDDEAVPVVVELNVAHPRGARGAAELLRAELAAFPDVVANRTEEYVSMTISVTELNRLVQADQAAPVRSIYRVWPDFPVHPLIDMSVRTVKCDAAQRSFAASGDGITWAVVDSGVQADHPHFGTWNTLHDDAVAGLHRDFTGSREIDPGRRTAAAALVDESGHGTHVAGIIAGGLPADFDHTALDVVGEQYLGVPDAPAQYAARTVSPGALAGMAPRARLVSLKVLPPSGPSDMTRVMNALRYVRDVNAAGDKVMRIHGVNLSIGYEFDPAWFACGQSPLCKEVDRLVRSGVVVVVAAGNTGYGNVNAQERNTRTGLLMSINDPGNAARAITVGSTHRTAPHTYGVSFFSSKGPTGDGRAKPDLVAPGERVTSCAVGAFGGARGLKVGPGCATYAEDTGTSFAAPHVSGAIAAFLSVRPEFVHEPETVKDVFRRSAMSLGREPQFEGAGMVDVMRALQTV